MCLFLQFLSLKLSRLCTDDEEFVSNLDYVSLFFSFGILSYFFYLFIIFIHLISSFLHIRYLLIPYTYVSIESIDHILLSSLALDTILLTFSVNTYSFPGF